ncbi:MAG: acyl--CoA ligase [Bacilli bacterium]|nr:acyl--CoA ligase [Bacilli bacterium]
MLEDLTLYQAYKYGAEKAPKETAIYYFNGKLSFTKLLEKIDEMAAILQNQFLIKKGETVLVSLPNIPQTIILFYAINKIGAICNMVHPNSPCEVMQKYYDDADCKLAFLFDQKVYKELIDYRKFNGHIVVCQAESFLPHYQKRAYKIKNSWATKMLRKEKKFFFYDDLKRIKIDGVEVPLSKEETSVLLHSASTTGESKTICLSSRSFNFTASRIPEIMCMEPDELIGNSLVSVLPSFHGFGLCMTMHAPLVNSFGVVLIPKFSTKEIAKMMDKCRNVICICGVPTVFKALLNDKSFTKNKHLKVLRSCFSGGDSLNSAIKEAFDATMIKRKSKCRLFEGYGLTEALSVCSVNTHRHHKYGSIGYPITGVKFRILDDNDSPLSPGQIGEISIKSDNNMIGYFKDEKASKAVYTEDGYLKTGDLGYIDEDGFLYFKTRMKRVIKVSGVAVFPSEIEGVISRMSGITAVCVIQIPDEKLINAVKAVIVAKNKNKERIVAECQKRLISWAVPKEIEFVDSLPYTKYHKINYMKVQEEENKKRQIPES